MQINEVHLSEDKLKLCSKLSYSKEVSHHHLCLTGAQKLGWRVGKLYSEKREGFRCPLRIAALGKLEVFYVEIRKPSDRIGMVSIISFSVWSQNRGRVRNQGSWHFY